MPTGLENGKQTSENNMKHDMPPHDEYRIRFLFYRLGMGAPSIALVLSIPVGIVEKYCKGLPTNERRRQIQLRTRYAGRHRYYEKKTKRLDEAAVAELYQIHGTYADVHPSDLMSDSPAFNLVDDMLGTIQAHGTACGTCSEGYFTVGSDTVTENRLAAIVASIHARNRCRIESV